MPIDNPVLTTFCNESIRPIADRLAGLIHLPKQVIATMKGKGLIEVLGTDEAALLRNGLLQPWSNEDYMALGAPQEITNSGDSSRPTLTNYDVIGLVRVLVTLQNMIDANPLLPSLVGKIAVNPRA